MADTARDRACEWLAGRLDSADEDDIPTITDRVLDGCYIAERWGVRYDADPRVHWLGQDIACR